MGWQYEQRRRWWFFGFLCIFLLALISFHHPLFSFILEKRLSSHLAKRQISFSFEGWTWKGFRLIFTNVHMRKEAEKGNEGFLLDVDQVSVQLSWKRLSGHWREALAWDHPRLKIIPNENILVQKEDQRKLIHFLCGFFLSTSRVDRGELFLEKDQTTPFGFCLDVLPHSETKRVCFYSHHPTERAPVTLLFSPHSKGLLLDLLLKKVDLVWGYPLIKKVVSNLSIPHIEEGWHLKQGMMEGQLTYDFRDVDRVKPVKCELQFQKVELEQNTQGVALSLPSVTWKREELQVDQEGEGIWPLLSQENIPPHPHPVDKVMFSDMHLSLLSPHSGQSWAQAQLSGHLYWTTSGMLLVKAMGQCQQKERSHHLQFTGLTSFRKWTSQPLVFDWSVDGNEGPMDGHCSLEWGLPDEKKIHVQCRHMGREQLHFMERMWREWVSDSPPLKISAERVSGEVTLLFGENRWKEVRFQQVEIEKMKCTLSSHQFRVYAERVEGKGVMKNESQQVLCEDGEIILREGKAEIEEKCRLDEVELHLIVRNRMVHSSRLSARVGQINGWVECHGKVEKLQVRGHLDGETEKFLSLLSPSIPSTTPLTPSDSATLDVKAEVCPSHTLLKIVGWGNLLLNREEMGREITFNMALDWMVLLRGTRNELHLRNLFPSCQFGITQLSCHALTTPFSYIDHHISGEGTFDLEGTLHPQGITFMMRPLLLHSLKIDQVALLFPKEAQNIPFATLTFDWQTSQWQGKINCQNLSLEVDKKNIKMQEVSGQVEFNGGKVHSSSLQIALPGLCVSGKVAGEYRKGGEVEVDIETTTLKGSLKELKGWLLPLLSWESLQDCPLEGEIFQKEKAIKCCCLVKEGKVNLLGCAGTVYLHQGYYPLSPHLYIENVTGEFDYDLTQKQVGLSKVKGEMVLRDHPGLKSYSVQIPYLSFNGESKKGKYDMKLETMTHDVVRLQGSVSYDGEVVHAFFDPESTHIFGAKCKVNDCTFSPNGLLRTLKIKSEVLAVDVYQQIELFNEMGRFPLLDSLLKKVSLAQLSGLVSVAFAYDRRQDLLLFEAKSDLLSLGPVQCEHLSMHGFYRGYELHLKQFESQGLTMTAMMTRKEREWHIDKLDLCWQGSQLQVREGVYDMDSRQLTCSVRSLKVHLNTIMEHFPFSQDPYWEHLSGLLYIKGQLTFNFPQASSGWKCQGNVAVRGREIGKGKLSFKSQIPLSFTYQQGEGASLSNGYLLVHEPGQEQRWAKCHFDQLTYHQKRLKGEQCRLVISPEMVHFLSKWQLLPFTKMEQGKLYIAHIPIAWENQIEISFQLGMEEKWSIQGEMKSGYYWIHNQSWKFDRILFSYHHHTLKLLLCTRYHHLPIECEALCELAPSFYSKVTIWTKENGEEKSDPLILQIEKGASGFAIKSIEGKILGCRCSLFHKPHEGIDEMALTGQVELDFSKLSPILPEAIQQKIAALSIGSGYELSGNLILSKESPSRSHFVGYFRGKNFQLLGFEVETLLSMITLSSDHMQLSDVNVSDPSGICSIRTLEAQRFRDQCWHITLPEVAMQNFRPKLLKKIGTHRNEAAPLLIRRANFYCIQGNLSRGETFTGNGELEFTHASGHEDLVADIPSRIVGTLGLDRKMLVPVKGKINFLIVDKKLVLTELIDTYSRYNHSQFFIAPDLPSYVDFSGNLFLNIRMKQFAIFKFIQPFLLTVRGTFTHPQYGLE